jgi:hypothetical protein
MVTSDGSFPSAMIPFRARETIIDSPELDEADQARQDGLR